MIRKVTKRTLFKKTMAGHRQNRFIQELAHKLTVLKIECATTYSMLILISVTTVFFGVTIISMQFTSKSSNFLAASVY